MASVRSLSFSFCPVLIVAGVAPGPFACGDCPEDIGVKILPWILAQLYWRSDLAVDIWRDMMM